MRRLVVTCVFLMFLCLCVSSCALNKDFVVGVDGYTQVILPEYKAYVEKDPALSQESKRIRTQTADRFQKLVDEAKEQEK